MYTHEFVDNGPVFLYSLEETKTMFAWPWVELGYPMISFHVICLLLYMCRSVLFYLVMIIVYTCWRSVYPMRAFVYIALVICLLL